MVVGERVKPPAVAGVEPLTPNNGERVISDPWVDGIRLANRVAVTHPSNFATRLDRGRLPQALVLMESILAQQPEEPAIFALCDDDESHAALSSLRIPQIVPVRVPARAALDGLLDEIARGLGAGYVAFLPCTALMVQPLRFPMPGTMAGAHRLGSSEAWLVAGTKSGARTTRGDAFWARGERGVTVGELASSAEVDGAGRLLWRGRPVLYVDFPRYAYVVESLAVTDREVPTGSVSRLAVHYAERVARAAVFARTVAPEEAWQQPSDLLVTAPSFMASCALREAIARRDLPHLRVGLSHAWDLYTLGFDGASVSDVEASLLDYHPAWTPPVPRARGRVGGEAPRVTAIVSTYAAERVIAGCLDDLVRQTLFARGELEVVVIDSASPESEGEVVGRYVEAHPERIRYFRSPQREGVYMAWNRGAAMARGAYLTNANTDDRHHPEALARLASVLDAHPQAALVYADSYITEDEDGRFETAGRVGRFAWPDFDHEAALHGCFIGPHPMWRKAVHAEVGWFDQRYRVAGDYEMWLRMAERYPIVHLPETLGLYQNAPGGVENTNRATCTRETISARRFHATRAGVTLSPGRFPQSYAVAVPPLQRAV